MNRSELVDQFAGFPERLADAVRAANAARRTVEPGEWAPAEVVRHLIAVEGEVWQSRLAQVATKDDPQWSWTEPGVAPGLDGAPIASIVAAFAAARAATVATVRALEATGWDRFGTHATYGRLDVEGLLALAIEHDEDHLESVSAD